MSVVTEKKEKQQEKIESTAISDNPVYLKWKEESKMVKGTFRCHEPRGGCVKFSFKKYKWDAVQTYIMIDGHEYEVPLAVARHLNQNCNYPVHQHILDARGNPVLDVNGKKVSRMNFESLEFAG